MPTIDAHRLLHYAQERGPKGSNVKVLDSLYKSYFEEAQPPASKETLMKAAKEGGLNETEVAEFLESGEDRMTIKNAIRRTSPEVDGVPHIVICGSCSRGKADLQEGSGISRSQGLLRKRST
jgi:predicted DsbA family dithiol-disulfide isomerase